MPPSSMSHEKSLPVNFKKARSHLFLYHTGNSLGRASGPGLALVMAHKSPQPGISFAHHHRLPPGRAARISRSSATIS